MNLKKNRQTKGCILTSLLIFLLSLSINAQTDLTLTVKGSVIDTKGQALIGANVLLQGTQTGTVTDYDGNFSLKAPADGTIEIKYIGYKDQVIKIANRTEIQIILQEDSELLDELLIIGYGKVKKADATGSLTAIDAEKLKGVMATSASDLLVGKVSGVSVLTDGGQPGAGATIRIRGGASMSASNDPLIVIDGMPVDSKGINGMSNPLSSIHPNDIETFTILKDASATAIYGSRASNGVIIINTKKGKEGAIKVNYSGNVSVGNKTNSVAVMGADEFRNFVKEKYGEGSEEYGLLGNTSTDWQKEIFRTAVSTDHNISFSGAVPHMPYRASISYTNENGILKTSNLERTTASISLNPNFFDKKLNVYLNAKGMFNKNRFADKGAINMATQFDPTQPIKMENESEYGNGYFIYLKTDGKPIDIGLSNPLAMIEERNDQASVYRSIGNAQADYKMHFLPELRANLNLGYDISSSNGSVTITDNSPMSWCSGNYKNGWGENTKYSQYKKNLLLDFYLNYAKEIGIHHFDAMGGYSWQHFYDETKTVYPYSAKMAEKNGEKEYRTEDSYKTENYLVSFFGRVNYSLLNKYLLTATLRYDASSRFDKENRWGLFPAFAFAWKLNEEAFVKELDLFSNLKLRLGYGVTGQQNLGSGDYPYLPRYVSSKAGASYSFGDTEYSLLVPLAYDRALKWEETTTWNGGLDFGFFNGRISGALDLYYRMTDDLLNTVSIPAGTNYNNSLLTNVGTLVNKGIELSLDAHIVSSKDWNWNVNYNVSYNKNTITKMTINDDPNYEGVIFGGIDGGTGNRIKINSVNHPYNSFYVFEQIYNEQGKPIEGLYIDNNENAKFDDKDLIPYRKSAPDVFMGLSSKLSYKNWDLSMALRASIGNYAYNNVQSNREAWAGSQMFDNTGFFKNRMISAAVTDFKTAQLRSSYYIQNASFLKLDNISIGYSFDKIFSEKQNGRLFATIQNPLIFTKYSGIDPEIGDDGIDNNIYPRPFIVVLGFNLNF